MGPTITMRPDEEKPVLATGELQKAFPPHLPPETEADRTPRGSLLACMTASREQSNQGFELTGRRRFALRAVASCHYAGEREPRTRGTSLPGQFPASDQCPFWVKCRR